MSKMLFISEKFEPFLAHWGSWAIPQLHDEGWILPLGWEDELTKRGIDFEEIEIYDSTEVKRLYFSTPEERDAFNAAEAEYAGADPSIPYFETGEGENGYYLLVDVVAKPSLWQHFKNWF